MKSIMEEASSIMEAIQKGWERAGKPQEFSVKVFEDAQTAFFGMRTVKSAKIALFFKEGAPSFTTEKIDSSNRPARTHSQADRQEKFPSRQAHGRSNEERRERQRDERQPRQERESRDTSRRQTFNEAPTRESREKQRQEQPLKPREIQEPRGSAWNDEMINWVNGWIQQSLVHMGKSNITFTHESSRNHLRIDFADSITGDEKKERMLFSSFAHLIMSSLRNKFKGDLKHLKVILNSK